MNGIINGQPIHTNGKVEKFEATLCRNDSRQFPISKLSYSLQKLILTKLKLEDRKFLAFTNRKFRRLIALFGPLEERIREIHFRKEDIQLNVLNEDLLIPLEFLPKIFSNFLQIKAVALDLQESEPSLEKLPSKFSELRIQFQCTVPVVRFLTKFLITRQRIPVTLVFLFNEVDDETCDCHPKCSNNSQTFQKIFRTKLPLRFRTVVFESKTCNQIPFSLSFGHPDIRIFHPKIEDVEVLIERLLSGIVDHESRIIGFHFENPTLFDSILQKLKGLPSKMINETPEIQVHLTKSEVWTTENGKCKRQKVSCQIFVHSRMLYFLQNYENSPEDCLVFLQKDDIFRKEFGNFYVKSIDELLPRKIAKMSIKNEN